MKSLQTIQKIFGIFQILAKITFVFSIVGASICAVGALCYVAWNNGGQVFSLFGEPITISAGSANMNQAMAELFSDMVFLITDAILLAFAGRYCSDSGFSDFPLRSRAGEKHGFCGGSKMNYVE